MAGQLTGRDRKIINFVTVLLLSNWIAKFLLTCEQNMGSVDLAIEASDAQLKEYRRFYKNNSARLRKIGLNLDIEMLRLDCQDFYMKESHEVGLLFSEISEILGLGFDLGLENALFLVSVSVSVLNIHE